MRYLFLFLYYGFAQHLPSSYFPCVGKYFNALESFAVRESLSVVEKYLLLIDMHILEMVKIWRLVILVVLGKIVLFLTILLSENML